MQTLDSIVRRGALTYPHTVALIDGEIEWTWADFDAAVDRAAAALRDSGVGPGDRVAACDYNSATYFALYYGAARLGAVLAIDTERADGRRFTAQSDRTAEKVEFLRIGRRQGIRRVALRSARRGMEPGIEDPGACVESSFSAAWLGTR